MDAFAFFRNLTIVLAALMLSKYILYLIVAPFYPVMEYRRRLKIMAKRQDRRYKTPYHPLVSIIVPAWNEAVGITRTIDSLVRNSYQKVEVIVVNDGSTDKTEEKVKQYLTNYIPKLGPEATKIRYFYKKNGGKGAALNYGINAAKGEIILTVDADSALASNAIENLVLYFEDSTIYGVVGNVKVAESYTLLGLIQKLEYLFGFYFKRTQAVFNSEYIFGGACSAYRSEVFRKIGFFDEVNKTEDIDMSMRARYFGYKFTYGEDVVCYTEGAANFSGLANQRLRWKKGRIDTFLRYRSMFFSGNKKHNRFLSWFVLPFTILQEFQLLVEPISFALLFAYSFISGDFASLTFGFLFIMIMYLVTAVDNKEGLKLDTLLLFPATWLMFYALVWIEFLAFIQGSYLVLRGKNISWQKWNRQGIYELN